MTREEAVKIAYDMGAHPYSIESMVSCLIRGAEKGATEQKEIDIEQIPQLYIRWLMVDGEKPTWKEYAIKAMEEWI